MGLDSADERRHIKGMTKTNNGKRVYFAGNIGIIQALKQIYEDPTSRGAAFNCCSAVSAFWYVYDVPYAQESEDGKVSHSKDEDCTVAEDGCCSVCGVAFGDPCDECGAKAFHKDTCSEVEFESRPWNIDKDIEQPKGEFRGARPFELLEGMKQPELANFGPFKKERS